MVYLEGVTRQSTAVEDCKTTKVLVVDPQVESTNLMRHGLQFHTSQFAMFQAAGINEARSLIAEEKPDIVVSELKFSDGTVFDLIPDDPESANYPVVVFTDNGSETEAVECLKSGALDYIVKNRRKCQEIGDLILNSLQSWSRIRSVVREENNLQQTLRLARSIMDSLPMPIGVLDKTGAIISTNLAWQKSDSKNVFFGRACCEQSDYLEFCRTTELANSHELTELIDAVLNSKIPNAKLIYSVGDPVDTWYAALIYPCDGTGRARVIVVHQDITDSKRLESHYSHSETSAKKIDLLTPREVQVMKQVVNGNANKAIATQLNISVKTVEMHRSNLMKKLNIRSVTDLVRLAFSAGFSSESNFTFDIPSANEIPPS